MTIVTERSHSLETPCTSMYMCVCEKEIAGHRVPLLICGRLWKKKQEHIPVKFVLALSVLRQQNFSILHSFFSTAPMPAVHHDTCHALMSTGFFWTYRGSKFSRVPLFFVGNLETNRKISWGGGGGGSHFPNVPLYLDFLGGLQ